MSNLQTFIISGAFSTKQVDSPPLQPCLSGLQILTESPKSVINDSAIISPESVTSDSMEHCLVDDMHQRYHDQEDLTSDASSTGLCSKRTTEEPKLSRELLYEQENGLPLKTLLRISSSRANDPMPGLDRKTSTQYQKKMPSTRRDGMVSEIGVEVQLLSDIMPIGTAGFDLPILESDKRDKSAVFDNPELHGFTTSGAAAAIKTCGWSTQGSFSNITSELESNQSSNSLTGIFPASDMLLPSEVFGQLSLFSSTDAGDARSQKREIPGRMMNVPYCLDNETSRSSDRPPTNISYSSKVQDNNTSLGTQTRTRNDYNLSTIKGGRYSPKNVPGKAIKPSTIMKPLPSKWDDAQKWLISSITNDTVAHRQADHNAQFSSPTTKSVTAYPNEVIRFKNNTSSTDHNLRLYGVAYPIANKLDNPISHGCPRQIQAPAKHPISSNDYALKSEGSSEKSSRGYDQKQKHMLDARTTPFANAQKLCIAHPLGNNDLPAAVKPSDINIEATLVKSPQPVGTIMNLSTGQRASLVCINPAEMTESERLFSNAGEIRAPNHVISYDVHMTDKYADRVVQTPDRSPRPTLKSEFLVQTPKLWDSLSMKDVATEVSPISRYRDMGTQMTPQSSSRPSNCPTPISDISPARHNTPAKQTASSGPTGLGLLELQSCQLIAKLENRDLSLQSNFNALERTSSNTWSTREEEEEESFKSLTYVDLTEIKRSVVEARATAWEEAEHTKRKSRYKREESKIQAWENHQKAKAEAEMRKLEVKLEKMRSHQTEKIMNKLAASHKHAENMRVAAQAEQAEQLAKSIERANQMRLSGHVPTPFCACFNCKT